MEGQFMHSSKEKLEALGYIINQHVQYWSLEHAEKDIYVIKAGELEEVCSFWLDQYVNNEGKVA
jgi:hypothetical protein